MKKLKTIVFISIVSVGMTSSVFASWWNPTTWKVFSKQNTTINQKPEAVVASTENELLSCNGSKYKTCPNGQTFICPSDGQDAYCDIVKKEEIKTPKIRESLVQPSLNKVKLNNIITSTSKAVEIKKTEPTTSLNPVAINNNSSVSSNPNNATNSPTYGVGFIMSDGTKILSPLRAYGFYKEIVEAEKNGLHGTYNQNTKEFISDIESQKRDDVYQAALGKGYTGEEAKAAVASYIATRYSSLLPGNTNQEIKKTSEVASQNTAQATQIKQEKLRLVNKKIADLNAKYASDIKNVETRANSVGGVTQSYVVSLKASLSTKYIEDYNILQAEWQQINYSE